MTSARSVPYDALVRVIGIADPGSRLEYSFNPSAETEAIAALFPVASYSGSAEPSIISDVTE